MPVRALDDRSFDAYVGEPAVVAFVRRQHGACKAVRTLLEALAPLHEPRVGFATVDVQDAPALAIRFAIDDVPTVLLFDDYRGVGRLTEPIGRDELELLIAERLGGSG